MSETTAGAAGVKEAKTDGTPALEVRSISKYFGSVPLEKNELPKIDFALLSPGG